MKGDDFRELARTLTRAQFIERFPCPFLVGSTSLSRPHTPGKTVSVGIADREALLSPRPRRQSSGGLTVLPVKKVQDQFPSMITVGRTSNNDVVIEDVQVSKFHAFFRATGDRMELADAGSRNGTFIGHARLETKGACRPIRNGEPVRFAHIELVFLDAGACWDRLH